MRFSDILNNPSAVTQGTRESSTDGLCNLASLWKIAPVRFGSDSYLGGTLKYHLSVKFFVNLYILLIIKKITKNAALWNF